MCMTSDSLATIWEITTKISEVNSTTVSVFFSAPCVTADALIEICIGPANSVRHRMGYAGH